MSEKEVNPRSVVLLGAFYVVVGLGWVPFVISDYNNAPVRELAIAGVVGFLGFLLGARSKESWSAMIGALAALMIWSALSYAVWQFYLWNLGREMERALNQ